VLSRVADLFGRLRRADRGSDRSQGGTGTGPRPSAPRHRPGDGVPPPSVGHAHDYTGPVQVIYQPVANGHPDPGEVVWTWVPYSEDATVGKDRPVVVLGRAVAVPGLELAVVMLSSKEHTGDPRWLVLGTGGWDGDGRPSSVRVDRLLAVAPAAVRREGAALDRARFEQVAAAVGLAGPRR
jgi:mRNA-degrading endonuclease toxin of MazEF toxin-antitoxin module